MTATLGDRMGTLIRQLPVNQAFTLEAGRSIWGFPKFMTRSTITVSPRGATIGRLADEDGDPILALRLARGWVPVPARTTELDTWSWSDGVLRRTPFTLRTSGTRARPGGATLQITGSHPMADDLRSLALGHAVSTMHVGRLSATFHAAVPEPRSFRFCVAIRLPGQPISRRNDGGSVHALLEELPEGCGGEAAGADHGLGAAAGEDEQLAVRRAPARPRRSRPRAAAA